MGPHGSPGGASWRYSELRLVGGSWRWVLHGRAGLHAGHPGGTGRYARATCRLFTRHHDDPLQVVVSEPSWAVAMVDVVA